MQTDPEVHLPVRGGQPVGLAQGSLRRDGALNGVNNAGELRKHAVSGGVGNPSTMGGDKLVENIAPLGQPTQCAHLIGAHQSAVTLQIGRKNRCQAAFNIGGCGQRNISGSCGISCYDPVPPSSTGIAEITGSCPFWMAIDRGCSALVRPSQDFTRSRDPALTSVGRTHARNPLPQP
jgi:hypothetical protein